MASFPRGFVWGSATAAYQIEGAWNEHGRQPSIWDVWSHQNKCANNDNGDVADDSYHRFEEDFDLLQAMGMKAYRFSLSWTRIMDTSYHASNPHAPARVNEAGIRHYHRVLDALQLRGIEPYITLYHWDFPAHYSYLGNSTVYNDWLDDRVVPRFVEYADACFKAFGSRVKHWMTFNEPLTFCVLGYQGIHAPGRCSDRNRCEQGDDSTEPYLCTHNVLKAHAQAVDLYRRNYQRDEKGQIGIVLNADYAAPYNESEPRDVAAAERSLQFQMAWFADPVFKGDYPDIMKQLVGDRLPKFTHDEKKLLKGSADFFALNHYTSRFIMALDEARSPANFDNDQLVEQMIEDVHGRPLGPRAESSWLYVTPWGFRKILHWIDNRYGHPPIFVTENGCSVPHESSMIYPAVLQDDFRIDYYSQYLHQMSKAIDDGVNVKGYFAWSLLDNFEWADGYSVRFGLHYVDYNNNCTRTPKASARFFADFIKDNSGGGIGHGGRRHANY